MGRLADAAVHLAIPLVLDFARLRHAVERAVLAVPRLRHRVVEAPLDVTLPHWEIDSTFDLGYHLRRRALFPARFWPQEGGPSHLDDGRLAA